MCCRVSLDNAVCAQQHRGGNREANLPGRLEVHDEFEPARLFDGQLGRFGSLEDLVDVTRAADDHVAENEAVGHETAKLSGLGMAACAGQATFPRELSDGSPKSQCR